jgi:hypothetical protein
MPKWQVSLTRDTSQDAELVIEAETAEEAKQIFLHDMDRDVIEWREGDWLGDADIVEVLPARDDTELTPLDAGRQKPRLDDGDTRKEFADIADEIHRILEDNEVGKNRVVLGPKTSADCTLLPSVWARWPACSLPITQKAEHPITCTSTPLRSSVAG